MITFQGTSLLLPSDAAKGRNPAGGKTLYVSNLTADPSSDDNEGTDPQYPLATIEKALEKVTTQKHDYIFVQDSFDQETFPVAIAVEDVHLIGLGNGHVRNNRCLLDGAGEAAITLSGDADGVEIAGFELGCTGAAASCILLLATVRKAHVHHCDLGSGIVALHGIEATGTKHYDFGLVDNNYFGRYLTGDGLTEDFNCSFVAHNWFRYYGGRGIYISGGQTPDILSNRFFKAQGAAEGWAISITGASVGLGMIDDNRAMEDGAVPANNPFQDLTSGGADKKNAWGLNYKGITATYPA